jgi:threonine aldolase
MGTPVDLRSDTVSRPTPEMRRAMAGAEVGDDGYGEDPTVRRLEEVFAARVGKEAAVYVPSGTMGNQLALRVLGRPGTAVIAGRRQHVVIYEQGGAAVNGWVQFHTVADDDGTLDPAEVAELIAARDHHWLPVSVVCVENTHMPAGGVAWPLDRLGAVVDAAGAGGCPVHLDGARLFNAEVATGVAVADYAAGAATVMCCLSKGLAAPVGSLLAGTGGTIEAARLERKRLGGAMRQAGVIAAAGLVALETMVDRLADDHARAARLAEAVADRWPDGGVDPASVRTNCVIFRHAQPARLLAHLADEGVLAGSIAPGVVRLMTHLDVDDDGVDRARKALASAP